MNIPFQKKPTIPEQEVAQHENLTPVADLIQFIASMGEGIKIHVTRDSQRGKLIYSFRSPDYEENDGEHHE
jgi:hypothetical protein